MTGPSLFGWTVVTEPRFYSGWCKLLLITSRCKLLLITTHCYREKYSTVKSSNTCSCCKQTSLLSVSGSDPYFGLVCFSWTFCFWYTIPDPGVYNCVLLSCLIFNISFVYSVWTGQRYVFWVPESSFASILKWSDRRATTCRWEQSLESMCSENVELFLVAYGV